MNLEHNSPEHNSPEHNGPEHNESPSNLAPKLRNALALISALCDGQISAGQFAELESLVCTDDEVGQFYVQMMHLNASLHHFSSYFAPGLPSHPEARTLDDDVIVDDAGHASMMDESMVLPAMLDQQSADGEESQERFQPASVLANKPVEHPTRPPYLKGGIAALLLLGLGILSHMLLWPHGGIPHPSVAGMPAPIATLNFTVNPHWDRPATPPLDGNFFASDLLAIQSGDVQLSFHHGGRIVIEGPAELEFISETEIALHNGKIVATVPGGGLVIRCPNGSVTDLGTEFGVTVHPDGATEVAVFKGSVSAALESTAATQPVRDVVLTVGQAALMTRTALTIDEKGAIPQHYVRTLVHDGIKSLDVTDLVSGGDGTTLRRGIGISTTTGDIGSLPPVQDVTSDGKYHPVKGFPILDGVFVPGGNKPDQNAPGQNAPGQNAPGQNAPGQDAGDIVDSAGDTFNFSTAANLGYNNIYTGGTIPTANAMRFRTTMDGVDYSAADHGFIFIHANGGLTLDLDAVRRIYPDRSLTGFRCRMGNSCPTDIERGSKGQEKIPVAAANVLVNGISRYSNPHFTFADGSFAVNIPLQKSDRFLTLASTDAGKSNHHDWVLWADAKLDLSAGN